jgi:hypothetical protein
VIEDTYACDLNHSSAGSGGCNHRWRQSHNEALLDNIKVADFGHARINLRLEVMPITAGFHSRLFS